MDNNVVPVFKADFNSSEESGRYLSNVMTLDYNTSLSYTLAHYSFMFKYIFNLENKIH